MYSESSTTVLLPPSSGVIREPANEGNAQLSSRGTLERYNGTFQLIVQRIRRSRQGEFDESDFCTVSGRRPEEMLAGLLGRVQGIRSESLRSLLSWMLGGRRRRGSCASPRGGPGGIRLHHAYRGGLLEHILSVVDLASRLTEHYPRLDLNLLVAGAILHGIGKIEELTATRRLTEAGADGRWTSGRRGNTIPS